MRMPTSRIAAPLAPVAVVEHLTFADIMPMAAGESATSLKADKKSKKEPTPKKDTNALSKKNTSMKSCLESKRVPSEITRLLHEGLMDNDDTDLCAPAAACWTKSLTRPRT